MELFDSYINFKKEQPNYKNWKDNKNDIEAKRLSYVEKNLTDAQKQQDIKRAKAVLHAVDTMDEYSQSRAEDTEIVIQTVTQQVSSLLAFPGMIIGGALALLNPKAQEKFGDNAILILPAIGSLIGTLAGMPFLSQWGARKEIQASMDGRFEAMTKDLASTKQFAVLTEEQEKQVEKIANTVQVSPKEAKKLNVAKNSGPIKTLLSFFKKEDEEITKTKKEFRKNLKADAAKFDTVQLSQEEIEEAKKDKQLIQTIVEKIDIASQDYAENIELATDFLSAAGLGGGSALGVGIKKLLGKFTKISSPKQTIISFGVGAALATAFTIFSTKLQKEGSRIARFKVKQDFLNNPDKLVYVDDSKVQNEDGSKYKQENKKQNIFKFLIQALKDNKEYKEYVKTQNIQRKQRAVALDSIELTPEQEKRAKQLQQNTFKMFNKLDEKSQQYAEQTEALGEVVEAVGSGIAGLFTATAVKDVTKIIEDGATFGATNLDAVANGIKSVAPILKKIFITMVPLTILNIIVTKEQKNASKVADMLALKEMDDYRNFADYSDKNEQQTAPKAQTKTENISPMLAKMIK